MASETPPKKAAAGSAAPSPSSSLGVASRSGVPGVRAKGLGTLPPSLLPAWMPKGKPSHAAGMLYARFERARRVSRGTEVALFFSGYVVVLGGCK